MLKKYPVLSFLVLTFAISWSIVAFMAATLVAGRWEQAGWIAMFLGGQFGPTIAAIIMTKVLFGYQGVRALLRCSEPPRFFRSLSY